MKRNTFFKTMITLITLIFFTSKTYTQCSELIFSDEFSGNSVDLSKWSFDNGDGCPTLCGWGNAEEQWYRPENTTVQNGNLVITTKNEAFGGKQYTSSKLITSGKFNSKYGRYEASIKLPSAGGIWPAFWMLPEQSNWPFTGEIDIMEAEHKNPTTIGGTVHYSNGEWQYNGREYNAGLDLSAGFHEYAVEWEPNEIRWYVDDQLYHTVTPANTVDPWPFADGDWYIILNVAVGGVGTPFTGNIPPIPADYPTQMEVDYVRVYSGAFNTQLTGDNRVYEGEINKTYSITATNGASYNWSVPNGASIISGQGTNSILVNWGTTGGDVKVNVNVPNCGENEYKMSVSVNPEQILEFVYDDFEGNRKLTYTSKTDGILTQSVANPEPNSVNNSSTVGKYVRATGAQYDGVYMTTSDIGNALEYTSKEKTIWMDVYSDAPIGTEFMLQIENGTLSAGDWPSGRHSRYRAKTTTKNQWETLEFELVDRPDTSVGALEVDQLVLLIDPDSYTGHTVYIDNIRKMDAPDAVLLEEVIIANYDGINQLTNFFQNGVYTENVTNPGSNSINNSTNAAKYVRGSTETYDVVSFNTAAIENSGPFIRGEHIFFMDVYTAAPAGTEISLSLENQANSENDFPAGRNSQFSGVVKEQNTWHTIAFSYSSAPDAGTSNFSINEISILFDPGSNTSETYYFDNFRYGITKLPPSYKFSEMIQDYNGSDNLALNSTTTGAYTANIGNPEANTINGSSQAGRYERDSSELYDVLFFDTNFINDASAYVSEEKRFAMDVYTSAPVGTIISWQLEASYLSNPSNYPAGRHSVYQAAVKEQNSWHSLEFVLTSTPDLIVTDAQIDTVVFLFGPNTSSGDVFYIDNLRSLTKEIASQTPILTSIVVNPQNVIINQGQTEQFDAQGFDQNGDTYETSFTWTTTGGSIDSNGIYTGSTTGIHTIIATSGSVSGSTSISVNENTGSYVTIPGVIEAEDYKEGGAGVGYYDTSTGNTGGAYRQEDVDIENTGDTTGMYNVGWVESGEWLAYTIDASASSDVYDVNFRIASPNGNGKFHLELDGVSITEVISVPNTNGWQNYETITINNILISSGIHELRIVFDAAGLNINYTEFKASSDTTGGGTGCSGSADNGDYAYEVSVETVNPTLTFVPEITGMGSTVCILYYSTSETGPYPGYIVTPNVPFQINANQGEQIYFYYTYSLPTGGENNTATAKHNFTVGNCNTSRLTNFGGDNLESEILVFPNPVLNTMQIKLSHTHDYYQMRIFDMQGKTIVDQPISIKDLSINLDMSSYETGLYFLKFYGASTVQNIKFLKK
ncbi:family 16 glycosylhydrolase [Aquimarina algiphila]|uniref:Family 16 glycosylhydrolase n=1 Tax=Aquimarina algiphila TaxID=2047982 RepID=A0A554VFI7_9FLAO|nr:family 16 glycosylhydrolase [Aquimarina algiphila]TSE06004.1 family 16 glycosylhydrolase [Aquimarina algiphila]